MHHLLVLRGHLDITFAGILMTGNFSAASSTTLALASGPGRASLYP